MARAASIARRRALRQCLLHGALALLAFITLFPLLMMIQIALKDRAQVFARFWQWPDPIRWENLVFGWEATRIYIFNSLAVSAATCLLTIAIAALAGYAFSQLRFPGSELLYIAIISLLMIPGILMLVPLFLTTRSLGLLNTYPGLILPQVAGSLPFALFLFRGFFDQMPRELIEAGRIDGAAEWQILRHVVVPLSMPIITTVAVLNLIASWNNYVWPLVIVRDETLRTIPLGLVFLYTEHNFNNMPDPGKEMAAYLIASIPMLLCFFFAMRTFIKGISSGALKL